jgi:MFS family permease
MGIPAVTAPKPDTESQVRWAVPIALMALCFISHFNRISMSVAADERIMKQYGIAPEKMGLVYSAFLLVYTVFMIPGGFFIDRFGPRTALALMAFGSAAFCMLTGTVGWMAAAAVWGSLLIVRGIMGLLTTPLHPAAANAVGLWVPESKRNLVNGLITGAALLGVASTYKLFGSLIAAVDWPRAFFVTGAITAVLGLLWLKIAPRREAGSRTPAAAGWSVLLGNRRLLLLTFSYAAIGYFQYLFFYWMHFYFVDVLRLDANDSGYYAGLPPLTMAFCMPIGGWLSDRFRARPAVVPMFGMLLGAALLGCGVLAKTPFWIVFWFSLALGAVGAAEAAFWSTVVTVGGPFGGTAAAIMNTGGNGGGMLAPFLTPVVSKEFGWPIGIALGGLICLAGALCWIGIKPKHEFQTGHDPNAG